LGVELPTVEFTDDVWRQVYRDRQGRQYILHVSGEPVYGVWFIPRDEPQPTVVVDSTADQPGANP
jgi:hypothetical protein